MNRIDGIVGTRVRALRAAREMTQADLAERIGVRFQQVQKYETGANRISASRLVAIAEALDVPVDHFFRGMRSEGASPTDAAADAHGDMSCELSMRMAVRYAMLSKPQKQAVLSLVESIAARG